MNLEHVLQNRKQELVQKWFQAVVKTYSADASHFFIRHQDPFTNPVGRAFRKGLGELFDLITDADENDPSAISACLDPMIRIRAVQNFIPSEALGFLFHLKPVLRKHLGQTLMDPVAADAFVRIEAKIDAIGLIAFNIYMECREKIYQLKSDAIREGTFKALQRAGLVQEPTRNSPDADPYH